MQDDVARDNWEQRFPLIVVNSKGNVQRYSADNADADDRGAFVPYSAYEVEVMNNIAQVARLNKLIESLQAQNEFQIGQTDYWRAKYANERRVSIAYEPPPKTIVVKTDALPMEFERMNPMTGTWRKVTEAVYREHDGHKRVIVVLESK
jgi:hypothetical protein